jgi:hypothetical protein
MGTSVSPCPEPHAAAVTAAAASTTSDPKPLAL